MEPLFQLHVNDIDILLSYAKEKLMLHNESAQVSCIQRISNLLRNGGAANSEAVLSKLIKFDVLSTIFEILQAPGDSGLLTCILDFLNLVIVHRKFYESHVAMDAVDSILKVTVCVIKSRCKETQLLEKLIAALYKILKRAVEFNTEFDTVCVPRQILIILKSLILENTLDQRIQFSAVAVLNIVLENIGTKDQLEDEVFELCRKALTLMKEVVDYSDDNNLIYLAADSLCAVCASATRLCLIENESLRLFQKVSEQKETLTKTIRVTGISSLLSYVKNTKLNETDRVKFHRNLVTCLSNLYKLNGSPDCDKLSNHLTANGYLKFFLLSAVSLPETLRRSTYILLTRIIVNLSDKCLPLDHCPEEKDTFETVIHHGLLDLPRDTEQWIEIVAHHSGKSAIALTTLIYYHYLGTREDYMISLKTLISRIVNLPKSEQTQPYILKVLWFLFAVGSVSHPSANMELGYGNAVKRLAASLRYSMANECYTHHIKLLHYCLKCTEFPRDLRKKAMDLWLIESDGDIKPLLTLDCTQVVQHYLLLVIQSGYSENIIRLAMKGIRDMMHLDNAKEISQIAWHMLPHLLSSHHTVKDEQIKAVLELTNISIPESLPPSFGNRCANSLIIIILRKGSDPKLKTLAIMQSYALLVTFESVKPFTILEMLCTIPGFLEEILLLGFAMDTTELSAVCLKLLTFIVKCQNKASVKRVKPLTIDVQSLADLLLNTRKSIHSSINALELTLALLTHCTDGSLLKLKDLREESIDGAINLFETLHMVYGTSFPAHKDTVYQCLAGVLKVCHEQIEFLLYHLCNSMNNYDMVSDVLLTNPVSNHFLDFVSTWLRYRKRYCTDEEPWNERSICKTPFEETLQEIYTYANKVKDSRDDAEFQNLLYALHQYKDYIQDFHE